MQDIRIAKIPTAIPEVAAKADIIDQIIGKLRSESKLSRYAAVTRKNLDAFFAPASPGRTEEKKREISGADNTSADETSSLEELRLISDRCTRCALHAGRNHGVFGEGNPQAELMFIGEGPGYDEDRHGRPFVGKAGQLLTKMIEAMQFTRDQVYIANIVKCRPPDNRNPMPEEAAACLPYLQRQIELIKPRALVLLGAVPLEHLMGIKGIRRMRGQWLEYHGIPVMPTYHPAYLLRFPEGKKEAWHDLQLVMKMFGRVHTRG